MHGQEPLGDAPIGPSILLGTLGTDHAPVFGVLDFEDSAGALILAGLKVAALAVALPFRIKCRPGREAVQESDMARIEIAFHGLQIVALEQALPKVVVLLWQRVEFELRK